MTDPLKKPATAARLRQLAEHGVLDASALERALDILGVVPSKHGWQQFINRLLLFLGVAFVLAGMIFFFAYNWADMGKFLKFSVLEVVLALSVFGAWRQGLHHVSGKAFLLVAAILPGPLFAVYGQVYQTGADPYELFIAWTLVISAWVVISQFAPLWLAWQVLLNISIFLYWSQMLQWSWAGLFGALALLNIAALVVWELLAARKIHWMAGRWMPRILFCAVMAALVIAIQITIWGDVPDLFKAMISILYLGTLAACLRLYQTRMHDLFMLAASLLSIIVTLSSLMIQVAGWDESVLYLFYGLLVVAQAGGAVFWLRRIQQGWEQ